MRMRPILAGAVAVASIAALAGCSGGGGSNTPSTNASGQPTGAITYEYFNNQPAAIEATKQIVADFEKKYPDVKVTLQVAPADSLQQKLQVQYAGGVAADVVQNDSPGSTLRFADYLTDLGSPAGRDGLGHPRQRARRARSRTASCWRCPPNSRAMWCSRTRTSSRRQA
ncbi:ABC transporter substrate-binding protein [Microbacterium elymi]|uniref:ABC transporter substrate-binding protein n=1 Tax=Microbacterium elymi TaxID=2909587 RepID=A0ABY5NHP3_9MICO|nr:ABC transporter substrate-binding protein [Microbacterium elymi]UUT34626.1 ABC transporter substrate-binding protein [Microbacterium elymi]